MNMNNNVKIKGNSNIVIQRAKKTDADVSSNNVQTVNKGAVIGVLVAIVGVAVAIVVGWDDILKFFN
jgi:hypothetical protein